jgi:hypothetical protein
MIELITRGKEALGQRNTLAWIWRVFGREFFTNRLRKGKYSTEEQLLGLMKSWKVDGKSPYFSMASGNPHVNLAMFFTHQAYIGYEKDYKEFGDITFATVFSSRCGDRIAYVNTFQMKVGNSASEAYKGLFSNSARQLNFYRRDLIKDIGGPYPQICDFLYYWLIGSKIPHELKEIPLSLMWLDHSLPLRWPRYPLRYRDTMLRSLFLITGLEVNSMLELCKPSLRDILQQISQEGVNEAFEAHANDTPPKPLEPEEHGGSESHKPSISSAMVVATEVKFTE